MAKFKIGDRVRYLDGPYASHKVGDEGVITQFIGITNVPKVLWYSTGYESEHSRDYLELVNPEFTDQELADRLREVDAERVKLVGELIGRGYKVTTSTSLVLSTANMSRIRKIAKTVDVTETVVQTVKKEITL